MHSGWGRGSRAPRPGPALEPRAPRRERLARPQLACPRPSALVGVGHHRAGRRLAVAQGLAGTALRPSGVGCGAVAPAGWGLVGGRAGGPSLAVTEPAGQLLLGPEPRPCGRSEDWGPLAVVSEGAGSRGAVPPAAARVCSPPRVSAAGALLQAQRLPVLGKS